MTTQPDYTRLFGLKDSKNTTVTDYTRSTDNPEHLQLLANHHNPFVVIAVILNPATGEHTLTELWDRRYKQNMIASLAHIIGTPLYEHIKNDSDDGYLLARNPYLTAELIAELLEQYALPTYENRYRDVIAGLAGNKATPTELLVELYEANPLIRGTFAGNEATPANLLLELAQLRDYSVSRKLVFNPGTPVEVLNYLLRESWVAQPDKEKILVHANYAG